MAPADNDLSELDEPRVTIEMGGPNIVIRPTSTIDREYTTALAHAVNAAADTHTVVVLDPDPIRCDEAFAGAELPLGEVECSEHAQCRPVDVEVVGSGTIRIAADGGWWLVDVGRGRICRTDRRVDVHFIAADSWTAVVAVYVTPTRLRALTVDGSIVTSVRAHDGAAPPLAV
jgi:hypothetical protein